MLETAVNRCASGTPSACGKGSSCGKRQPPGKGQSGCAFRGAKMALQPIADAAHLVHGPASCETGSWEFRPVHSSGPDLHRHSFTSDLNEMDLVYGGERKLLAAIGEVIERYRAPAVFVYQTCLPAMTGDNIVAVCRTASAQWFRPVIPVNAPGLAGSRPYGGHLAAEALLQHVIATREPDYTTPADIVLIGEFNLAGEIDHIRRLLSTLGIRILASITGDGRFGDIAAAHRAKGTVLLCSQGLDGLAEGLFERFGVPFIEGSFYGAANTSDLLRRLASLLASRGAPSDLPKRASELIREQEAAIARPLGRYRSILAGKRFLLLCGGAKSWSVATTLLDAGMEAVGVSITKISDSDRRRLASVLGDETRMIHKWGSGELEPLLRSGRVDIVLGGGVLFPARRARIPWLEVNHDRSHALCGYEGALTLLEQVSRALASPLWKQAREPAPWQEN
jgi:nitrogenase molybdenum-cofactor synthesis protein NifE